MDEVEDQCSTEPAPSEDMTACHVGPRVFSAGELPPQELVDAVLAHDRRRIEQIRDPNLLLLINDLVQLARSREADLVLAKRRKHDDQAEPRTNVQEGEYALRMGDALLNFVNRIPLLHELDVIKPFRNGLIALQDYLAGSEAALAALRGKKPNKTNPKRPSTARQRAVIKLFVHALTNGGTQNGALEDVKAERLVAKHATDNGLKRTRLGVHGVCVAIDMGEDKEAADLFETLKAASLPADVRHWSQKDRLTWVKRRATIFLKL